MKISISAGNCFLCAEAGGLERLATIGRVAQSLLGLAWLLTKPLSATRASIVDRQRELALSLASSTKRPTGGKRTLVGQGPTGRLAQWAERTGK